MRKLLILAAVGMLCLWGCGSPTARATGTVTLAGKTLEGAEITFERDGSPEYSVHGKVGPGGRFYLYYPSSQGMPPGKYRIVLTRYTLPNGKPLPSGEEGEALRSDESRVNKRMIRFERDLSAGNNSLDLEWNEGQPHHEP